KDAEHKEDAFDPNICYVLTINPTGQQKYAMEVERESNEGFNVLSLIVQESDLECLKQMIELGGKIEVPSNDGVHSVLPMAYKRFLTVMAEEEHLQGINAPFSVTDVQHRLETQRQYHELFKFVLQNLADTLHNSGIHYLYSKWSNTRSALKSDFLGEMLIQCYGFQVLYDSVVAVSNDIGNNSAQSTWTDIALSVLRYFKKVSVEAININNNNNNNNNNNSNNSNNNNNSNNSNNNISNEDANAMTIASLFNKKNKNNNNNNNIAETMAKFTSIAQSFLNLTNLISCASKSCPVANRDCPKGDNQSVKQRCADLKVLAMLFSCIEKHLASAYQMELFQTSQQDNHFFQVLYSKFLAFVFVIHKVVLLPHYSALDNNTYESEMDSE
ncbi:hypothetical protein RFI_04461, partial [Reticulomyxa filosa]